MTTLRRRHDPQRQGPAPARSAVFADRGVFSVGEAGTTLCLLADAAIDLRAVAEALEAQRREYGETPLLTVATKRLFLGMQRMEQAGDAALRWQRADQERTGYPERYRRE